MFVSAKVFPPIVRCTLIVLIEFVLCLQLFQTRAWSSFDQRCRVIIDEPVPALLRERNEGRVVGWIDKRCVGRIREKFYQR